MLFVKCEHGSRIPHGEDCAYCVGVSGDTLGACVSEQVVRVQA